MVEGKGEAEEEDSRKENTRAGVMGARGLDKQHGNVHPASKYQEGIEREKVKEREMVMNKEMHKEKGDDSEVLWRRPSGDGEIGGRWYKAATGRQ